MWDVGPIPRKVGWWGLSGDDYWGANGEGEVIKDRASHIWCQMKLGSGCGESSSLRWLSI